MKWSGAARLRRTALEKRFADSLREISDAIASQQEATEIAPAHVNRAYETVAAHGFCARRWRPAVTIGLGTFLLGISGNLPSWIAAISGRPNQEWANVGLLVALFGGVVVLAIGWWQNHFPSAPRSRWYSISAWAGICVLLVAMLAISILNVVSQQTATSKVQQSGANQPGGAKAAVAPPTSINPASPASQGTVPSKATPKP